MAINSVLSTAISGLQRNAERVHDSANKIANLNARPTASDPAANPATLSGSNAIDAQLVGTEQTSLVREFANLIEAKAAYSANLQVIKTAEELSQLSQDILA